MSGALPGWMLAWVLFASLVLLGICVVLFAVARCLRELKEDLALGRLTNEQLEMADIWKREPRHGLSVGRRISGHQVAMTAEPKSLETEGTRPMTLEERAALIDARARDSYYHGTYCAQVPAVALLQLQEAVAQERFRCARLVEKAREVSPEGVVTYREGLAEAIWNPNGTANT